jgi:hypothetical protein
MTATALHRALAALGIPFFSLAVYVQFNDPDPWAWGVMYGVAALLNLLALFDRLPMRLAAAVFAGYVVLTLYLSPHLLATSLAAFASVGMQNLEHELVREAWGAATCAVWTFVLWRGARRTIYQPSEQISA